MPGTPGTYGYCVPSDCDNILTGFVEGYYGSGASATTSVEADINGAYRLMNDYMGGYPQVKKLPVAMQGSVYPQTIIDCNAYWTIHRKLKNTHAQEFEEGVPNWINNFYWEGTRILKGIKDGKIVLDSFTSVGEVGIGQPEAVATSANSTGTFYTNWEGYSGPFYGDLRRTIHIVIDGAGSTGGATFKWSKTAKSSYEDTGIETNADWQHLEEGIYVRFSGWDGTAFAADDEWKFDCVPLYVDAYGDGVVKIRTMERG